MKLSVQQQTYESVWLSSTHWGSLLMQRGLSLALGLTVGLESTWGTSPRGFYSLLLKESKWSFVVPCRPLVTTRDHSSFSVSVSLRSSLVPYEVSVLYLLGADGICWWLIFLGSRQHFRLLKCTTHLLSLILLKRASLIRNYLMMTCGPCHRHTSLNNRPSLWWPKLVSTLCHQPGSDFQQLLLYSSPCICVAQSPS